MQKECLLEADREIMNEAAAGDEKCFFLMEVVGFVPEGLGRMGGRGDVAGGSPRGPPSLHLPLHLPSCPISRKASEFDFVCDELGVSKLVGKASEFTKKIGCPMNAEKNESVKKTDREIMLEPVTRERI